MPRGVTGSMQAAARRAALVVAAITLGLAAASEAQVPRQSAIQLTPDSGRYMISKPVGNSRWVITYNLDDKTVTGNVFNTETDDVDFLWCRILTDEMVHQPDPLETSYPLQCFMAAGCAEAPCSASAWTELVGVQPLAGSFLLPPGTKSTLAGNVQPIYNTSCATSAVCHGNGAQYVVLSPALSYANTFLVESNGVNGMQGPFIAPFDPGTSFLLKKLEGSGAGEPMPYNGSPLPAGQIDAIRSWILEGAANN